MGNKIFADLNPLDPNHGTQAYHHPAAIQDSKTHNRRFHQSRLMQMIYQTLFSMEGSSKSGVKNPHKLRMKVGLHHRIFLHLTMTVTTAKMKIWSGRAFWTTFPGSRKSNKIRVKLISN